ncbi:uncharacterized protein LOC128552508 [Mercenaria mercenaria]|uniref:uncharacterized protein LOC128552508 n=1 Tax=Mercenaria mercenaria TaxID=6596 RepID=UPI00234E95D3|nr:uncharacterized protein LOC128552508 [Mercenaria mercenaria]
MTLLCLFNVAATTNNKIHSYVTKCITLIKIHSFVIRTMYRSYNLENLQRAVSAVRRRQMGVRSAATEFNVPKSTLHDHVNRKETKDVKQEQTKLLTIEEENALVQFIQHQARQGFPMTRSMVRCYVREIVRRSGRETAMNLESGPSDKWFRALKKRHPELSERTPECLDRARCRMSNQETMNGWFELLRNVLETNQLKESQVIFKIFIL